MREYASTVASVTAAAVHERIGKRRELAERQVVAQVSEPRQRVAAVHDEADEPADTLREFVRERLEQQVMREPEPVSDGRQFLQMPV